MWEATILGDGANPFPDLKFYIKSAVIPQVAKDNIVIDYMDRKLFFAGKDASNHTIQVTFWDDESLKVLRHMDRWMRMMGEKGTGQSLEKEDYIRTLRIKLKDTTDVIDTATIELTKVYPLEISDASLSYDSSDVLEFSVTFCYDERIISDESKFSFDYRSLL
jgi:hypothetical protein